MVSCLCHAWSHVHELLLLKYCPQQNIECIICAYINAQDSQTIWLDKNVITWGCINGWYRLVYQNLFTSCFVRRATRISTNQSDKDWHHASDSCTLEVFRVSPKHEFAHFYLALLISFTFWKWNRYRHLWMGITVYRRLATGFGRGHGR